MKVKIITLLCILLYCTQNILAIDKNFIKLITVKDIMNNLVEKYETINTYVADFTIKSKMNNRETTSEGQIKYKIPDNFIMLFKKPEDQIIYSDGRTLKIYVPDLNILGEQSLEHYRPGFLINSKTSLYYLRNKYDISFYKSNKPVMINNINYYILELEQKDVASGFKSIILYVSQFWLIEKAEATTLNGNRITINFKDIVLNTNLTDNEFKFNLPVNTQTIKNPLLLKIEGE